MAEALARVKQELGDRAVILHTRTIQQGGFFGWGGRRGVEITAGEAGGGAGPDEGARPTKAGTVLRPELAAYRAQARPASDFDTNSGDLSAAAYVADDGVFLRRHRGGAETRHGSPAGGTSPAPGATLPGALVEAYTELISREVAEELARRLVRDLGGLAGDPAALRTELLRRIAELVPTAGAAACGAPGTNDGPRVIALVGPTGVGKTTTLAKLAAHARLRERRRVGLITIDRRRIGAVEQLRVYADLLEIPLAPVATAGQMSAARARLIDCDLVLIDTAGQAPGDAARMAELRGLLEVARPDEVHLVLASTHGAAAAVEAARAFAAVGAKRVIFTKLDEAVGLGVVLTVLERACLRVSYVTAGESVPGDLDVAEPSQMARWVLGESPRAGGARQPAGS